MKKISKLFLAAAVAFGVMACNKEEAPNVQQEKNATVSLKITHAGTRASSSDASALAIEESNIKKLDVFVFNGDAVDAYKQATDQNSVLEVKDIPVTTGSRTLIVVANATEDLSTITSKTTLKEKVEADLATQKAADGLLMTAEETNKFTIKPGKNYYGYTAGQTPAGTEHSVDAPIQLKRVAARIALVSATTDFKGSYEGYKFEPEEVFLFNAKKQSKYFGESLVAGSEYLSGVDLTNFKGNLKLKNWDASWTVAYLKDAVTDLSTISATAPVYYYTFENDASVQPTVLTIKGKIKNSTSEYLNASNAPGVVDANGFTYYSIVVNGDLGGYSYTGNTDKNKKIVRNTQYNLSVVIKRLGKDDPTDPPTESAILDVKVKVVPWTVVKQSVEY